MFGLRVLVACEFSGTVRDAFASLGHDAWSCDLLPSETKGNHYQGDVLDILGDRWDLMIAHPPCTYLAVSGMHWTTRGYRDPKLTEDALDFVQRLLKAPIPKIALENPVSVISSRIRKPDQIIHPYWFGDDASKKTCLWLKGLPKLQPDPKIVIAPRGWRSAEKQEDDGCTYKSVDGLLFKTITSPAPKMLWANQTPSGQNRLGPSDDRWKLRSITYRGVADAMARQWGLL